MNPKMKASALFIAVLSPVPRSSILLLCCAFMSVWAQQETGSITGQVADASGAAVPHAQSGVRDVSASPAFSTAADDSGLYRVPQLAPGKYTITATAPG